MNLKRKNSIALIIGCLLILTTQFANAETTLRLAEGRPGDDIIMNGINKFVDLVDKYTDGVIKISVFNPSELDQKIIEQTQAGIFDLARVNTTALANVAPSVGVFSLPYIFRNEKHKYTVLDGNIGTDVRAEMLEVGLLGFDFMEAGSRCFYTREGLSITKLEDMEGLRIRVRDNPISIRMVELLGGTPVLSQWSHVFDGINSGAIDGAENKIGSFLRASHWQVAKNYVVDYHLSSPVILVMNKSKYDGLPANQQDAISRAAKESALYQRQLAFKTTDEDLQTLINVSTNVTLIDNIPFQGAMKPLYDDFPHLGEYIMRIQSVK